MRSFRIVAMTVAAAALQPASAQNSLPSPGLHIAVHASYLGRAGDTVSIAYTVLVQPGSTDSLMDFVVDAPTVLLVVPPGAVPEWSVGNRFHKRPIANWSKTTRLIVAGDSTPPLVMRALGLTDVKQYWGDGDIKMDSVINETTDDSSAVLAAINDTTITMLGPTGWTVGVSAMPQDLSATSLAARLN